MKAKITGAVLAAVAAGVAIPAVAMDSAAVLKQVQGSVLVNKGQSYRTVGEGTALDVGDRVMIMEGGSAVVVHADGCSSEYHESQIVTILPDSPCAGGVADTRAAGTKYANPIGAAAFVGAGGSTVSSTAMVAGMTAGFAVGSAAQDNADGPISGE